MSAIWTFDGKENKDDVHRGDDSMRKFSKSLREHTMKIINFEKKKTILLTKKTKGSYERAKICYICKKKFKHKYTNDKNYWKVKDHCH